jgi:hypothetical protein
MAPQKLSAENVLLNGIALIAPLDRHRQTLEKVLRLQWLVGDFRNTSP